MSSRQQILQIARRTLELEAKSILEGAALLNQAFEKSVELIASCKGRVIVTGIGKSAAIANKIVATFNSTGTPAIFMHAAEAVHGDLGVLLNDDLVLCISNSGNSPEIKSLIPYIKSRNNQIIALVGDQNSFLAKNATYAINAKVEQEASSAIAAPTSSTTLQLALGDALAVCLMDVKGFSEDDFAKSHPGGAIGKRLSLKVKEVIVGNEVPIVAPETSLQKVIYEISSKRMGATAVITDNSLVGMITDGDIRRMLQKEKDLKKITANDIMSSMPTTIKEEELAVNAMKILQKRNISQIAVVDKKGKYVGIVHFHDLIKEGLST